MLLEVSGLAAGYLGEKVVSDIDLGVSEGEAVAIVGSNGAGKSTLLRALAGRPRVLLLDEVMAGLNETELAASVDIVRRVRDELGTTIMWVEHVMSAVIQLAERAIVLNFGEVLTEGAPEDVMRDPAVVDAYLGQAHAA